MSKNIIKNMIKKSELRIARCKTKNVKEQKVCRMGCKYDSSNFIKEFENKYFYIPPSDYSFIRCLEKMYDIKIKKDDLNPFGNNLQKIRNALPKKYLMPDTIRVKTKFIDESESDSDSSSESDNNSDNEESLKYIFETIGKGPLQKIGYFIMLIELHEHEFHAVLVKEEKIKDFKKVNRPNTAYLKVYNEIKDNMVLLNNKKLIKPLKEETSEEESSIDEKSDESANDEIPEKNPKKNNIIIKNKRELELDELLKKSTLSYILTIESCQLHKRNTNEDKHKYYDFSGKELDEKTVGEYVILLSLNKIDNEMPLINIDQLRILYRDIHTEINRNKNIVTV
jgi:hypothetical protein